MLRCLHRVAVRRAPGSRSSRMAAAAAAAAAAIPAIRLQVSTASLRRTPTATVSPHYRAPVCVRAPVRCMQMASGPSPGQPPRVDIGTRTLPEEQRGTRHDQLTNDPPSENHTSTPMSGAGASSESAVSAALTVQSDVGLGHFLSRVYRTTGFSVATSLAIAYGIVLAVPGAIVPIFLNGLAVSVGSAFCLLRGRRPVTQRAAEEPSHLITVNSKGRQALFSAFIAGTGAALSPLVLAATAIHPLIVPSAVATTTLTMFGASYYAYKKPSGAFLQFIAPLSGATLGLIGLELASVGALYSIGPNAFTSAMWTVYPCVAAGLLPTLTAVNTYVATAEYGKGHADHLHHAVSFYMNALRPFTASMRATSISTSDEPR